MARKSSMKPAMARAEKAQAPKVKQYISESHDYDSSRPKKQGRSQYKGAAGTAY